MSERYEFGEVTCRLLVALHEIAVSQPEPYDQDKLDAVASSDSSGYAFAGLDEGDAVHVGLFFARQLIDAHSFENGNKRTATALFKYIVKMSGASYRAAVGDLPGLINKLHGIDSAQFTAFALGWPDYKPESESGSGF